MNTFDAIIIGSGIGGMCAAARLTAKGFKVAVLEKSRHLGGRCSHRVREECYVSTGAIMIPMGENSAIRQAFDAVGAEMDMVDITGHVRYRLHHGDYDLPPVGGGLYGMIEFAFKGDEIKAKALFQHIVDAMRGWLPLDTISIREWFDQYTDNTAVKNLFQGYCAALMGTNLHEIPAGEFFRFLKYSSKGSRFGLATHGNGDLMETLAGAMEKKGAVIRRSTNCHEIIIEQGKAIGVTAHNSNGQLETMTADYILSNTGPDKTVELVGGARHFEKSYIKRLHTHGYDAPIIHISFVTDEPLIEDFFGSLVFGNTKSLIYLEIPSIISPGLAPDGKYLHTAYAAPADAAKPNLKEDMDRALAELEQNFPGFTEKARFLVKAKHRGQAPGMHRWPGYGMPVETPITNLFNVGDGCIQPGTIGTEGAAASAKAAVAKICR